MQQRADNRDPFKIYAFGKTASGVEFANVFLWETGRIPQWAEDLCDGVRVHKLAYGVDYHNAIGFTEFIEEMERY